VDAFRVAQSRQRAAVSKAFAEYSEISSARFCDLDAPVYSGQRFTGRNDTRVDYHMSQVGLEHSLDKLGQGEVRI
jgi:hypothetical protein